MKFRLRLVLPALATAALLTAAPGVADNSDNRSCPNQTDWLLVTSIFDPKKDKNGDGLICQKIAEDEATKDSNNPPEFTDNAFRG